MEHVVAAAVAGVVREVRVHPGDTVLEGTALMLIDALEDQSAASTGVQTVDLAAVRPDLAELQQRRALTLDPARPDAVDKRHQLGLRTARVLPCRRSRSDRSPSTTGRTSSEAGSKTDVVPRRVRAPCPRSATRLQRWASQRSALPSPSRRATPSSPRWMGSGRSSHSDRRASRSAVGRVSCALRGWSPGSCDGDSRPSRMGPGRREGVVLKDRRSPSRSGSRRGWAKVKAPDWNEKHRERFRRSSELMAASTMLRRSRPRGRR